MQNVIHRLTTVQQFKPQGILVTVNGSLPVVAYPNANPVTKRGKKQFYFYYRNRTVLAMETQPGKFTARF